MTKNTAAALHAANLVQQIKPILAGNPPDVLGAVLADLTSMWVAGHPPSVRDVALAMWLKLVEQLIPMNAPPDEAFDPPQVH